MRLDLLQQLLSDHFAPRVTHRDIERELRSLLRTDPEKAERAVGALYGHAFRRAEEAYAARGSRGRQEW